MAACVGTRGSSAIRAMAAAVSVWRVMVVSGVIPGGIGLCMVAAWCAAPRRCSAGAGGGQRGEWARGLRASALLQLFNRSIAVGVVRAAVVPIGNAVSVTVAVVAVGHAIAVSVVVIAVVAVGNTITIAVTVIAVGDAVAITVPAAWAQVPPAAVFHPARLAVVVTRAGLDPVALDPDMAVAAPIPITGHPHHVVPRAGRHFMARGRWGAGLHHHGRWRLVVVGLPRLDDNSGAGLCLRHRCGAGTDQGDGNSGECIAGHGDLLRMIDRK